LFSRNRPKFAANRHIFCTLSTPKCIYCQGSAPDLTWELTLLSRPLSGFNEPLSGQKKGTEKGREDGKARKGKRWQKTAPK